MAEDFFNNPQGNLRSSLIYFVLELLPSIGQRGATPMQAKWIKLDLARITWLHSITHLLLLARFFISFLVTFSTASTMIWFDCDLMFCRSHISNQRATGTEIIRYKRCHS